MQTFLPYPDFARSAQVLDYRRLGKQRVEARQIRKALLDGGGWRNHPATRMWDGYIDALDLYTNTMITEWLGRGYKNNMIFYDCDYDMSKPSWFGDDRIHSSHRAALLFKNPQHYGQFGWTEEPKLSYVWPI